MSKDERVPSIQEILGALLLAAKEPLTVREVRRCLQEAAEEYGQETAAFAELNAAELKRALGELADTVRHAGLGFHVAEVAGSYRLQNDPACGRWLKVMLAPGRSNRLSRPALETLAIIAYRQPVTRSEIEGVRGVGVDHVVKTLMEMQLVRIAGRSDLPGRPLLYGTTHAFLEHFGLKSLKDLQSMEPMLLAEREKAAAPAAAAAPSQDAGAGAGAAADGAGGAEQAEDADADEVEDEEDDDV